MNRSVRNRLNAIGQFWVLLQGLLLLSSCSTTETQEANKPPNVVFILADDLGWADLPVYGNQFNEAPNIDTLAAEGIRFTDAYAACPVCSPTRASIMSGQYPARVGIIDYIPGQWRPYEEVIVPRNRTQYLPEDIETVGEMMQLAGYKTGYFGKWHLGDKQKHHPLNQGFDVANVGKDYYNTKFDPPREVTPTQRLSESLTNFGIEFIEQNKDQPFFLFLAHYDVHLVLDAEEDLIRKYADKPTVEGYPCNPVYAAMIEHLDNSVGRINRKLKELGLDENTILIFYSDNGGLRTAGNRGLVVVEDKRHLVRDDNDSLLYVATENTPLRDEKGTVYEGGIREPLIVKWPKQIRQSQVSNALISSVDFFPTLIEVSNSSFSEQVLDGKSILPELTTESTETDRALYWHYPVYHHGVPSSAVRQGDWKLVRNLVDSSLELYNLKNDISETQNLIDSNPAKAEQLASLLTSWSEDVGAEFPKPNPEFDPDNRKVRAKHPDLMKNNQ